jgi:hypothetical protein
LIETSFASIQDRVGINAKHIPENHRHSKAETTRKYIHADNQERRPDMSKLKLKPELHFKEFRAIGIIDNNYYLNFIHVKYRCAYKARKN